MKLWRGYSSFFTSTPCALTIGNFDGVHLGHQALLAVVRDMATCHGLVATVMTFEPHPREFFACFSGKLAPTRITSLRDKWEVLQAAGMEHMIVQPFNTNFAQYSPKDFIENILVNHLQVKSLIVGEDFRFGARREGTFSLLKTAATRYGFRLQTCSTVMLEGERISSSGVRHALSKGDFVRGCRWLGRPYLITGRVIHGKKLGRTLGFPTMNIRMTHRPALSGIFVVQVHGLSSIPLPAVASIGSRPTVDNDGSILLETHVFDYAQDTYGQQISVEFLKKRRDEQHFADVSTLIHAMQEDVAYARCYFLKEK